MLVRFLVIVFAVVWSSAASAVTISFAGIPYFDPSSQTYDEAGFRVEALGDGDFGGFDGEHLHVDSVGGGGPYADTFRLTSLTSQFFTLFAMDILAYDYDVDSGISKMAFSGFRGGAVVSTAVNYVGTVSQSLFFGDNFASIDALLIEADCVLPADYCGLPSDVHFNIDNIVVAPVPLPAALPLLAAGLFGLGFIGRRKRKTT